MSTAGQQESPDEKFVAWCKGKEGPEPKSNYRSRFVAILQFLQRPSNTNKLPSPAMIAPSKPFTVEVALLPIWLGVPLLLLVRLALDELPEPEVGCEALEGAVGVGELEPDGVTLALADFDALPSVVTEPEIETEAEGDAVTATLESDKVDTGLPAAAQACWNAGAA